MITFFAHTGGITVAGGIAIVGAGIALAITRVISHCQEKEEVHGLHGRTL